MADYRREFSDDEGFDELPDRREVNQLFGEEDDDYQGKDEYDEPAPVVDRRSAMQQLAQRVRDEEVVETQLKRRKKAQESGSTKRRREDPYAHHAQQGPAGDQQGHRSSGGGYWVDEDNIAPENEGDRAFIDDTGVPEDERFDDYDNPDVRVMSEAEEGSEDDIDAIINKNKRRRHKESMQDVQDSVNHMLAKMDRADEMDRESHHEGKPAFYKLRMCQEAEDFVAKRQYHDYFIDNGGLTIMKKWLQPYGDLSLPNAKVRGVVLRMCKILPINTESPYIRDKLKESGLGTQVMFLSKCPDESITNRKLAKAIVDAWSRPIYFNPEEEKRKKEQKLEALVQIRRMSKQQQDEQDLRREVEDETGRKRPLRPGDPGYRIHAAIPRASKLDYVKAPESRVEVPAAAAAKTTDRFAKKMRDVVRKNKGSNSRAMKPSIEGRGMVVYH